MVFNVTMWLMFSFRWFPGCCYTVVKIFYIAKVFHAVARVILYNWKVFNMLLWGC